MPPGDVYRDDLAYIHDAGYGEVARDAARRLIKELSSLGCRAGTVADLGCGSGVLAQVIAEAGYDVLGIDLSDAMVALARTRVPAAEFRVGSFVTVDLPPTVAVSAVGEVLSYAFDPVLDDGVRVAWLRRVYEALRPGGLLLFDVAGPGRARPGETRRTFTTGPDWAVQVETVLEEATGTVVRNITSFRQVGALYRRDVEVHRLVLIDPAAVLEALHTVGFDAQILTSYDSVPLPPGVTAFRARRPVARSV